MPRRKFIAGNWKMNTTKSSAVELARAIAAKAPKGGVDVGVAPPFVYLDAVSAALANSSVLLGAQDVYYEKNGAFTGEISTDMLKDLGVKFCLTGHSERRHVLHESSKLITWKSHAVYHAGLILVHCVGEKLEERDAGKTFDVVQRQLEELTDEMEDPSRVVIAYEPVWAIGTGRTATDAQAQEVHAYIRGAIAKRWNLDFAERVRIQYGGSMKPENAKVLLSQKDVDGGLIGGAALKAESFLPIVAAAVYGRATPPRSGRIVRQGGKESGSCAAAWRWYEEMNMLGFFFWFFIVLFVFVCILLVLLVLIQKGRGGGLSGAFGGAGGNTAFGSKTGDVLTWVTSCMFGVFLLLAIAVNLLANARQNQLNRAAGITTTATTTTPPPK